MWRGCVPTMARAMSMNLGMMATNDQVKEIICNYMKDDFHNPTKSTRIAYFHLKRFRNCLKGRA